MIPAEKVANCLYDFSKTAFKRKQDMFEGKPIKRELEPMMFEILETMDCLTVEDVKGMTKEEQHLLFTILLQYIMFLMQNKQLNFPDEFIIGSSRKRLKQPLIGYMAEHTWPYPQLLPQ